MGKIDWIASAGAGAIGLGLALVLSWFLPFVFALAIGLTAGIAWREYRVNRSFGVAVIPATIALAYAVAQWFPLEQRGFVAIPFGIAGLLFALWLRSRELQAAD